MSRVRSLTSAEVRTVVGALRAEGLPAISADGSWLGVVEAGRVVGTGRILERQGIRLLEDVWVEPAHRGRGVAAAVVAAAVAAHRPLWLICDEDMVGFYARRGFEARPPDEFPEPLAALYAALGEWPGRDHLHVAMRTAP